MNVLCTGLLKSRNCDKWYIMDAMMLYTCVRCEPPFVLLCPKHEMSQCIIACTLSHYNVTIDFNLLPFVVPWGTSRVHFKN